jgi:hypothetical protein
MKNIKTFEQFINETTLNASYNNALRSAGELEKKLGIMLQTQWNSIDGGTSHLEREEQDAVKKHGQFAVFTIESLPKGTAFSKSINDLKENLFLLIWEDGTYQFRKGMQPIATPLHSSAERSKIKSGAYIPRPLKELDLQCLNHCLSMAVNESVNEGKSYKGREVLPNWIDPNRDFGKPVKNRRELKSGAEYILWEPGMDTWQAEYIYQGQTGGKHIFNSSTQFGDGEPMEFTDAEIDEYIKSGDIIKQN